jgi:hypothetical protein
VNNACLRVALMFDVEAAAAAAAAAVTFPGCGVEAK